VVGHEERSRANGRKRRILAVPAPYMGRSAYPRKSGHSVSAAGTMLTLFFDVQGGYEILSAATSV
jgi:hypothetical protein